MPHYQVTLPRLHADQMRAWNLKDQATGKRAKRKAIRCGRRWGKTALLTTAACDMVANGKFVGLFTPSYKYLSEPYNAIADLLQPITERRSKTEGVIKSFTGGQMDFWTLEDDRAGRGRKYHTVLWDEAAFNKPNAMEVWEQAVKPTLLDFNGDAWALSNTKGNDPENFFWKLCNDPKYGFTEFHAPSHNNPLIPLRQPEESEAEWLLRREASFEELKRNNHHLVYRQEYLAEWVDFSGEAFFAQDKLLDHGQPLPYPATCDGVFAVVDSATKTGKENDATAVIFCAITSHLDLGRLLILDYDAVQVEGAFLADWLPGVMQRLEELAVQCGARNGSLGVWIEDKDSGQVLLQHGMARGWHVHAIDTGLTAKGKDERAIATSSFHFQGLCRISDHAFNKTITLKGTSRNHLLAQITGFRVGDKDAAKRADDLLDTYTYAMSIALGNSQGW